MNLSPEQQCWNDFLTLMTARDKDTPAKLWWNAPVWHPATGRALGIDRDQDGGYFALYPFRTVKVEDQWRVLAAYPTPTIIGDDIDQDWLGIEAVISWEPLTNAVEVMGDGEPQIVGTMAPVYAEKDTATLFGQPRAFFQTWAMNRARFYGFARQFVGKDWTAMPDEPDLAPGALIVGDIRKIRWNRMTMPANIECVGCDPDAINRAMLRDLKLPRLRAGMDGRAAA